MEIGNEQEKSEIKEIFGKVHGIPATTCIATTTMMETLSQNLLVFTTTIWILFAIQLHQGQQV